MKKQEAMDLLGCRNLTELADALSLSKGAVSQWRDPLPESAVRRVESKLYRKVGGRKNGKYR